MIVSLAAFCAGLILALAAVRCFVRLRVAPALLAAKSIAEDADRRAAEASHFGEHARRMMHLAAEAKRFYESALSHVYTAQAMELPEGYVLMHPHLANRYHAALTTLRDPRPLTSADLWPGGETPAIAKTPDKAG